MSGQTFQRSSVRLLVLAVVVWGHLLVNISAIPLQDGTVQKPHNLHLRAEGEEENKKTGVDSWGWEIWLLVIGGAIIGFIVLSCLISYLFCACAKEIICLPITCLTKVLCCCCSD